MTTDLNKAIINLIGDDDISDGAKAVYVLLCLVGNMSLEQLSVATGKSKPSMSRYCVELTKSGHVVVTRAYHDISIYRAKVRS